MKDIIKKSYKMVIRTMMLTMLVVLSTSCAHSNKLNSNLDKDNTATEKAQQNSFESVQRNLDWDSVHTR